jgi:hypothetical protein
MSRFAVALERNEGAIPVGRSSRRCEHVVYSFARLPPANPSQQQSQPPSVLSDSMHTRSARRFPMASLGKRRSSCLRVLRPVAKTRVTSMAYSVCLHCRRAHVESRTPLAIWRRICPARVTLTGARSAPIAVNAIAQRRSGAVTSYRQEPVRVPQNATQLSNRRGARSSCSLAAHGVSAEQ